MKTEEWGPFLLWAGVTSAFSGCPIQATPSTQQVAPASLVPHQVRSQASSTVDTASIMTEFKLLLRFCVDALHSGASAEKVRCVDSIRNLTVALGCLVLDHTGVEKAVMRKQMVDFDEWIPCAEENVWSCRHPSQLYFPCDAVVLCFGNQVSYTIGGSVESENNALLAVFLPLGVRNEPDAEKAQEIMARLAEPPMESGQCHYWTRYIDHAKVKQHDRDMRVSVTFEKALATRLYSLLSQRLRAGAIQPVSLRLLVEIGEDRSGPLDMGRGKFVKWPESHILHSSTDTIAIWDDGVNGLLKRIGIYSLCASGIYDDTEIALQLLNEGPALVSWAWTHALQRITPTLTDVDDFLVELCNSVSWGTDKIDASALLRNAVVLQGFPVHCDVLLTTPSNPSTGTTIIYVAGGGAHYDSDFLFAGTATGRAEYLVNKCLSIPPGPRARYPRRVILLHASYTKSVRAMLVMMGLGRQYFSLEGRLHPLPVASAVQYSQVTIGDRKALADYIQYLQRFLKMSDPESYAALRDGGYGTRFAALLQRDDAIQPVKDLTIDFILPGAPIPLVVEQQACPYKMIEGRDGVLQLYVDLAHLSDKAWLQAVVDFIADTVLPRREFSSVRRQMGNFATNLMKSSDGEIEVLLRSAGPLEEGEECWFGSSAISAAVQAATEAEIQKLVDQASAPVVIAPATPVDASGAEIDAVVEDAKAIEEALQASLVARMSAATLSGPLQAGQQSSSSFGCSLPGPISGSAHAPSIATSQNGPSEPTARIDEEASGSPRAAAVTSQSSQTVQEPSNASKPLDGDLEGVTSHSGLAHAAHPSATNAHGNGEGGSIPREGGVPREGTFGKPYNTYIVDDTWQDVDVSADMALELKWLPVLGETASAARTGREGESLAYRYLRSKYSSDSSVVVVWTNEKQRRVTRRTMSS
jgi:hypothetical protein